MKSLQKSRTQYSIGHRRKDQIRDCQHTDQLPDQCRSLAERKQGLRHEPQLRHSDYPENFLNQG